ncbi:MAG TPA: SDR family oxidoreductase, partial [Rubricoccaceae bacterium]
MPRSALITGAASGIGRATAQALGAAGVALVLTDIDEGGLAETASGLAHARTLRCDVSVEDDVQAAVAFAVEAFGPLDVLVQSAGIEGPVAPLVQQTADEWARVFGVNVMGTFFGLRHALPVMARGGSVVNVASIAGLNAFPLHAAYAASKHAVVGITRTAAVESARAGIRVNAVCPGFTDTPMVEDGLRKAGQTVADLTRLIPARRLGTPAEVAAAIAYLCSDAAAYITGQTLVV